MRIIRAFPPNFREISEHFPIRGRQGLLYSWGDTIYNPSGVVIPPWLIEHEEVHGRRQMGGIMPIFAEPANTQKVRIWWDQYLHDKQFRLREELLAHRAEFASFQKQAVSFKDSDLYLDTISERLSSSLYGNMVTQREARDLILDLQSKEH